MRSTLDAGSSLLLRDDSVGYADPMLAMIPSSSQLGSSGITVSLTWYA